MQAPNTEVRGPDPEVASQPSMPESTGGARGEFLDFADSSMAGGSPDVAIEQLSQEPSSFTPIEISDSGAVAMSPDALGTDASAAEAPAPEVTDTAEGQTVKVSEATDTAVAGAEAPTTTVSEAAKVVDTATEQSTEAKPPQGEADLAALDAKLKDEGNLSAEDITKRDELKAEQSEYDALKQKVEDGDELSEDDQARLDELAEKWDNPDTKSEEDEFAEAVSNATEGLNPEDPKSVQQFVEKIVDLGDKAAKMLKENTNEAVRKSMQQAVENYFTNYDQKDNLTPSEKKAAELVMGRMQEMSRAVLDIVAGQKMIDQMQTQLKAAKSEAKQASKDADAALKKGDKDEIDQKTLKHRIALGRVEQYSLQIISTDRAMQTAAGRYKLASLQAETALAIRGVFGGATRILLQRSKMAAKTAGRNIKSAVKTTAGARPLAVAA